jgi:hypothetical protein
MNLSDRNPNGRLRQSILATRASGGITFGFLIDPSRGSRESENQS